MNQETKNVLRWIGVLPVSLISGFLATFPLHLILYLAYAHDGTILGFIEIPPGSNLYIEHLITPFVIAITFILVGFKIAPKYKFKTSIIFALLWIASFIGLSIFMKSGIELRGLLSISGSLIGLYVAWNESKKLNNKKHDDIIINS